MKLKQAVSALVVCAATSGSSAAVLLSETFENVAGLAGSGWVLTNNSQPLGDSGWFQGNAGVFAAADGPADAYAGASFTGAGAGGVLSNWLITPELALDESPSLSFALRLLGDGFLDTVEVYFSSAGASADVGSTATSTGDFSLLDSFASDVDTGWVVQSLSAGALASGTTGRFAFRFFVADTDTDGNYVGIDSVLVRTGTAPVPLPATLALAGLGLVALAGLRRRL